MRTLALALVALFTLLAATASAFHSTPFKIRVDITQNKITLTPAHGCSWSPATFSKNKGYWPRLIVTSGEAYVASSRATQPTGTFSFVLIPEDNGAKLTSICGPVWSSTSFHGSARPGAPVSWYVDTMGVNLTDCPE